MTKKYLLLWLHIATHAYGICIDASTVHDNIH